MKKKRTLQKKKEEDRNYTYETRKKKYTYRTTAKSTKEKKKVSNILYKTREGRRVEFEGSSTPFFPNNLYNEINIVKQLEICYNIVKF